MSSSGFSRSGLVALSAWGGLLRWLALLACAAVGARSVSARLRVCVGRACRLGVFGRFSGLAGRLVRRPGYCALLRCGTVTDLHVHGPYLHESTAVCFSVLCFCC